jgi:hypothetical protein
VVSTEVVASGVAEVVGLIAEEVATSAEVATSGKAEVVGATEEDVVSAIEGDTVGTTEEEAGGREAEEFEGEIDGEVGTLSEGEGVGFPSCRDDDVGDGDKVGVGSVTTIDESEVGKSGAVDDSGVREVDDIDEEESLGDGVGSTSSGLGEGGKIDEEVGSCTGDESRGGIELAVVEAEALGDAEEDVVGNGRVEGGDGGLDRDDVGEGDSEGELLIYGSSGTTPGGNVKVAALVVVVVELVVVAFELVIIEVTKVVRGSSGTRNGGRAGDAVGVGGGTDVSGAGATRMDSGLHKAQSALFGN